MKKPMTHEKKIELYERVLNEIAHWGEAATGERVTDLGRLDEPCSAAIAREALLDTGGRMSPEARAIEAAAVNAISATGPILARGTIADKEDILSFLVGFMTSRLPQDVIVMDGYCERARLIVGRLLEEGARKA